jgi:hypothetical protein
MIELMMSFEMEKKKVNLYRNRDNSWLLDLVQEYSSTAFLKRNPQGSWGLGSHA